MGFTVGKKYKVMDKGLAESNEVTLGAEIKVTALDRDGDAWSNEVSFMGVLGSDRTPKGSPEKFTGVPVETAGWCFATTKELEEGLLVEVEE